MTGYIWLVLGLMIYIDVTSISSKWMAPVCNKGNPDESKNRVHLGTFPTAEMAGNGFVAAVLLLRGDSSVSRYNFPEYSGHVKSIIEGCSPSEIEDNMKYVVPRAAENMAPLISVVRN